jgi:hypothetical protein
MGSDGAFAWTAGTHVDDDRCSITRNSSKQTKVSAGKVVWLNEETQACSRQVEAAARVQDAHNLNATRFKSWDGRFHLNFKTISQL